MATSVPKSPRLRFGAFELDPQTGELVRDGQKTHLHEQPLQVLLALLRHPGELVTREELRDKLWPAGTFVDFERGLNKAISKLRDALRDSAAHPQFIETLPRKGYRFVGTVTADPQAHAEPAAALTPASATRGARWKWGYAAAATFAVLGLAVGIKMGSWRPAIAHSPGPSHQQIDSLAVLPLENLSRDSDQEYFADGMTDALITEIARAAAMRVVSRTTIERYKATQKTTRQIGRELNVDAIVEGTILHSGDRVRITAQLIQVSTDNHIWAQSYERDVHEVLRLQQEVATDIAHRIGSIVKPVEPARTVNPQAYGEYLKGRYYFLQYTPEGWQEAIVHFNLATQADPNFAPAFAGLAESYLVARGWNAFPPEEALRKGKMAAVKAIQIDPTLASSHLAIAAVYAQEGNAASAEREFSYALELNPNDPLAWQQHGNQLLSLGQFQQAIAEQERARTLDPYSPIINANLARAYYYSRQYDSAIVHAQETLKLEPGYAVALRWLERSYRQKGLLDRAATAHLAAAKPEEVPALERAYRAAGYRGILQLELEGHIRAGALVEAARCYAQIGDKQRALATLEELYRRKGPGLSRLQIDPDFDSLRSDSHYQNLLRQLGESP